MAEEQATVDSKYLPELMAEKDSIDPSFVHAVQLISKEIERIKNPQTNKEDQDFSKDSDLVDIHDSRLPRASCCIKVPTHLYPSVNFVGRLIGPGGSTLKGIQDVTSTRIGILGKGSMRDKAKADELLKNGDAKYQHLKLPLHVRISGMGPLDQVYMNIGRAVNEISKLLHVDEEELAMDAGRGRGMGRGGGARGGMRGRGGRGGASMRGSGGGRGTGGRGARGSRGGTTPRGGNSGSRGRGAGARGGYGAKSQATDLYATAQSYEYTADNYEGYGAETYGADASYDAYGAEAYGADAYAAQGAYGADATYGSDAYGYGEGYEAYGNGSTDVSGGQYGSKPFHGKMRGGGGRSRGAGKPY